MFSLDREISLNLERTPFRALLCQIALPYRNEVLFDLLRPAVEAPEIPIVVDHAGASLDGGSLAVCRFKHKIFKL
jgi:hypothetical protein